MSVHAGVMCRSSQFLTIEEAVYVSSYDSSSMMIPYECHLHDVPAASSHVLCCS
jgi:hypothetical protein